MSRSMSRGARLTKWALLLSGVLLTIAESSALIDKDGADTISAVVHNTVIDYPVISGLLAATIVHFCTPTSDPNKPCPWWQGTGVALVGGTL